MPVISAIRQAEGWSGASRLLSLVVLVALVLLIVWGLRRFISGSRGQ